MNHTRDTNSNQFSMTQGLIPPQAIDIEEALLGAILIERDALMDAGDKLKSDFFYKEPNKKIFEAIISLYRKSQPIDILTVTSELRRLGTLEVCGGAYYVTNLTSRVTSGANVEYYAKIVEEKYIQREMIRISSETMAESYLETADVFDIIEKNQTAVFNVLSDTYDQEGSDLADLIKDSVMELELPCENGITGIGSGFIDLDKITGGWQKQDLIIIAARPAMGKTAFMLKCARNAAVMYKKPTVIFSLEMGKKQLSNRILSDETGINHTRILRRNVYENEIRDIHFKITDVMNAPMKIDDTASLNIFEFRAKCRRLKKQFGLEMIFVDYLQLMNGERIKGNSRDNEIGSISRTLKAVAKELDVPVIALSQLSREVEKRPSASGKRPMLSDLRESGSIEQDADQVLFLYRPEYYGITEDEQGRNVSGRCEVIVAKNRSGVTDIVNLKFNGSLMRFSDIQEDSSFMPVSNNFYEKDDIIF